MRWVVIIVVSVVILIGKILLDYQNSREISNSTVSLEEQRRELLIFEKRLECEAHSLCWDATVDGKGVEDPYNAVQQCTIALERQDRVIVSDVFPQSVRNNLMRFKHLLRVDTVSSLEQAKEEVAARQRPKKYGVFVNFKSHPTCAAYSVIDKVNRLYDVEKLMKGHYINCDVLNESAF